MFKIEADPTFEASITIIGQGREQTLNVTFKHKTRVEYMKWAEGLKSDEGSISKSILQIMEKWDANAPLTSAGIKKLQDHQPGADLAIIQAYGQALLVERKKN